MSMHKLERMLSKVTFKHLNDILFCDIRNIYQWLLVVQGFHLVLAVQDFLEILFLQLPLYPQVAPVILVDHMVQVVRWHQ